MVFSITVVSLLNSSYRLFNELYCSWAQVYLFFQGHEFGDVLEGEPGENATVEKQGCHPFYESLIADPYVAEVSLLQNLEVLGIVLRS